jgi:predicted glycoside hydrolase/deacetylase ChbG (UPF0249 family)
MKRGARVLLVNADDFGIYPAASAAVIDAIDHGIAASCSVLVLGPGAPEALRMLADRPDIAFGVHLTLVTDFPDQQWSTRTHGRSLLDASGRMFGSDDRAGLLRSARIDEVEAEFRAQVEVVLDAGLTPTHLDWHCLADGGRADIFDVTLMLADEYGIAVRAWLEPARRTLRDRGLPVVDHDFLDSFSIERPGKRADRVGGAPGLRRRGRQQLLGPSDRPRIPGLRAGPRGGRGGGDHRDRVVNAPRAVAAPSRSSGCPMIIDSRRRSTRPTRSA